MARLDEEAGNHSLMMMMGLGVVGSGYETAPRSASPTPPPWPKCSRSPKASWSAADSPYRTVGDLVAAWKASPETITVGGGSAVGGPDHLFPMELARTAASGSKT